MPSTKLDPADLIDQVANAATFEEAAELLDAHFPDDPYDVADLIPTLRDGPFLQFDAAIVARYQEIRARERAARLDPDVTREEALALARVGEDVLVVLNACKFRKVAHQRARSERPVPRRVAAPPRGADRVLGIMRGAATAWQRKGRSDALDELESLIALAEAGEWPRHPTEIQNTYLAALKTRHDGNGTGAAAVSERVLGNMRAAAAGWRKRGESAALAELDDLIVKAERGEWVHSPAEITGGGGSTLSVLGLLKDRHLAEVSGLTRGEAAVLTPFEEVGMLRTALHQIGYAILRHRELTEEGDDTADEKLWACYAGVRIPNGVQGGKGIARFDPLADWVSATRNNNVPPF